jgi:hypothetical protein
VLVAFHYYHDWSHAHAFEHTRRIAGAGEGLYVSYLFTGIWIADVTAWWKWPRRYAARPALVDLALHGFMVFMVFNSMVVFESGMIRWAGMAMFAGLGWDWRKTRPLRASFHSGTDDPDTEADFASTQGEILHSSTRQP